MTRLMTKIFEAPPFDKSEILRYAGCRQADAETNRLLDGCLKEAHDKLTYKVCYGEFTVAIHGDRCDFGVFSACSEKLAFHLEDCKRVLLFGATVGVGIDRLIAKYGRISPAKALLFQAMGAERIEALCDTFCVEYEASNAILLGPRFSPGYGDLSLSVQKEIFAVLDLPRKIGLSLTDSLLMTPSKSVTAFAGIAEKSVGRRK